MTLRYLKAEHSVQNHQLDMIVGIKMILKDLFTACIIIDYSSRLIITIREIYK